MYSVSLGLGTIPDTRIAVTKPTCVLLFQNPAVSHVRRITIFQNFRDPVGSRTHFSH
jgi:hypothetical protein